MELVTIEDITQIQKIKISLEKLKVIFQEIVSNENSELEAKLRKSQVIEFLKILYNHKNYTGKRQELAFVFYDMLLELENSFFGGIGIYKNIREKELPYEFKEVVENYYQTCLEISSKYKVSPIEYYELLVNDNFKESQHYQPTLYYVKNLILRFLKDGRIIIVPYRELLDIHLCKGKYNSQGLIILEDTNDCGIYFRHEYTRWRGVGKETNETTDHYRLCPNTLQLDEL